MDENIDEQQAGRQQNHEHSKIQEDRGCLACVLLLLGMKARPIHGTLSTIPALLCKQSHAA
jgi:hypothetical protein